ncbi:MAG: PrsW family glutamic-type intramembrane protease [Candidatus Parcubacteria bacterium]|nr:PrsW family glutamic-type intramembrane protease [Candidatus Parcubacteria bacterium]
MAENLTATVFFLALAGGILPALFWLWFWLKEDPHPEPRRVLMATFFGGMIAVGGALVAEYLFSLYFSGAIMLLFWAFTEEALKYFAAWRIALTKPSFDEPIDALIYLITAALGFASLENILFSLKSFSSTGLVFGLITGNLRFIGATLLHTACSAIVGASIAFCFFHKKKMRHNVIGGIILATILHFIFNYFIIKSGGENILKIFLPLWLGIIIIIFIFEKVKRINN